MRLYAIVGPDDKTGPIAEELRILPTDSAETIERKAVDIKERLNRERGHRGTIGVRIDDTLRCEHRYRWQALLAVRRYGRKFDHFSPTGDCVNFITVLIDGDKVAVRENRWDYERENRKWDLRNRIYSLLHPYSDEERILYRIRHAFHYKRRLSRKYGLHIYSSRNRQFPYFVREYDECMTEKEIARAVLYTTGSRYSKTGGMHYGKTTRMRSTCSVTMRSHTSSPTSCRGTGDCGTSCTGASCKPRRPTMADRKTCWPSSIPSWDSYGSISRIPSDEPGGLSGPGRRLNDSRDRERQP